MERLHKSVPTEQGPVVFPGPAFTVSLPVVLIIILLRLSVLVSFISLLFLFFVAAQPTFWGGVRRVIARVRPRRQSSVERGKSGQVVNGLSDGSNCNYTEDQMRSIDKYNEITRFQQWDKYVDKSILLTQISVWLKTPLRHHWVVRRSLSVAAILLLNSFIVELWIIYHLFTVHSLFSDSYIYSFFIRLLFIDELTIQWFVEHWLAIHSPLICHSFTYHSLIIYHSLSIIIRYSSSSIVV